MGLRVLWIACGIRCCEFASETGKDREIEGVREIKKVGDEREERKVE